MIDSRRRWPHEHRTNPTARGGCDHANELRFVCLSSVGRRQHEIVVREMGTESRRCRPSQRCVCPLPTIPPAASAPLLPPRWRSAVTPPSHGRCRLAAARAGLRPPHQPLPTLPQRRRVRRPRALPPRVDLWRASGPSPRVRRRPAAAAAAGCLPAPDGRTAPVVGPLPPASRGGSLARRRHVGDCRRRRGAAAVTEATPPLRGRGCGRARRRARAPTLVVLGPLRHVRGWRRGGHPKHLRRASAGSVTAQHAVPAARSVPFGPVAARVDRRHAQRLGEVVGAPAAGGGDAKWHPTAMRECQVNACRKKRTLPNGEKDLVLLPHPLRYRVELLPHSNAIARQKEQSPTVRHSGTDDPGARRQTAKKTTRWAWAGRATPLQTHWTNTHSCGKYCR